MAKAKKLLIVESPAKARTLGKFLGSDFTVKASSGHVRDLQKGGAAGSLGIDVQSDFTPHYQIIPGKEKTIETLKGAALKASVVYLAPDPDREGEAIAWHIQQALDLSPEHTFRISYNAVSKKAVLDALKHPRAIDMNLVNAQQGRRILDRLVGFKLSPFLWSKVAKGLSAGRVQSVAVRLLVERELSIKAFTPETYWSMAAELELGGSVRLQARLSEWAGKSFGLGHPQAKTEEQVQLIADQLRQADYSLQEISSKEQRRSPPPPFITSTLQQSASTAYGFSPSRTMGIAQRLYEGVELGPQGQMGLITYMRTDSVRVEPEAIEEVRNFIGQNYSKDFLPAKAHSYASKGGAQDAHEAIRPVNVSCTPEMTAPYLNAERQKLYTLIWQRFVSSQMSAARYQNTTVHIAAGQGRFEAKGRVTLFAGYTVLWKQDKAEQDQALPQLQGDEAVQLIALETEQHSTKPPARYSEAGLVKALEREGIGRPSTYAPIIQTIQERGYASTRNRSFHATALGIAVTQLLQQNFPDIVDLKFTAGMEEQLDQVEEGKCDWVSMLHRFYTPFVENLHQAERHAEALGGRPYEGDARCPLCKHAMVVRYSQKGVFLSCERYPECKGSLPYPEEGAEDAEAEQRSCPDCGRPMLLKTSRFGKKFYACSGYPECKTTASAEEDPQSAPQISHDCDRCGQPMVVKQGRNGYYLACSAAPNCPFILPIDKNGQLVKLPPLDVQCDQCGRDMIVKIGPRGPFLSCSGYPECKSTLPLDDKGQVVRLPKVDETCEKCGKPMAAKMGRRGPFIACTGFPKCRNAKPLAEASSTKEAVSAAPAPASQPAKKTKRKAGTPATRTKRAATADGHSQG